MGKRLYKHMNVDVLAFLREQMEGNTEHYQSDFEIDKNMIRKFAESLSEEDKTLLWMSRPMGTHLQREREVFIRDTYDHNTWKFYAEQTKDKIVAFAVELIGKENGIIRGNVYELDYLAHAALVAKQAVPALAVEKTFENGFIDRAPMRKGTNLYYYSLIEKNGPIVKSRTIPQDEERLESVLAEQRALRLKLKVHMKMLSIAEQIEAAEGMKTGRKVTKKRDLDLMR